MTSKSVIPVAIRPFIFSLLVTSSWSVKGLHLANHVRSLGPLDWAILLPLFLLEDIFLLIIGRVLLERSSRRWKIFDAGSLGLILAVITTTSAAMEIAFYWETSAEIKWSQAGIVLDDPEGMKLLFSGAKKVFMVLMILLVLAKASGSLLYDCIGSSLDFACSFCKRHVDGIILGRRSLRYDDEEKNHRGLSSKSIREHNPASNGCYRKTYPFVLFGLYTIALVWYISKTSTPYKHLMGSLPFTLIGDFEKNDNEFCSVDRTLFRKPFPLAGYLKRYAGDSSAEWAPWNFTSGKGKPLSRVDWLPTEPMEGFSRWYSTGNKAESNPYEPRYDPLRISNSKSPILDTLQEAFRENNVVIKNVLMLTMESTRKDVFPFKKDSPLHKIILSSHEASPDTELLGLLANISRTSEILSGETSGFESIITKTNPRNWINLGSNFGGLNVNGAISSSTYTLKNLLTSHCGVGSLPVDFGTEAFYDIYQPCLPHILGLFNSQKRSVSSQINEDYRTQPWDTAYLQAATDQFDHQSTIVKKMGFSNTISREQLQDPKSKFNPPTEPEFNYLGYSDAPLKPYIKDIIETARDKGHRFFTSVLTSTTHYPWVLPPAFGKPRNYMGGKGWVNHKMMNDYLNTIKYADVWLAEIMDILEDTGVADETLVVVAGDHGFAFVEDDLSYSVYDGAHISNFKIPLLFHHPKLPRVQLSINASTMSILPTILDLLVSSHSLGEEDGNIASHLVSEYQGQSLLREFKTEEHSRQTWHISLLNPGGSFLAISSAAVPWRLLMPLCKTAMLRFTDLSRFEMEEEKIGDWSIEGLRIAVAKEYGEAAARWAVDAKAVGTWWFWETRRLWNFGGTARQEHPGLPEFLYERLRVNTTSVD